MGLSGAERQRLWRQRHKGEPTAAQLKAKLAELEAVVSTPRPAPGAARLLAELPELPDDWTADEEIINEVIERLNGVNAVIDDTVKPLLVCLPDLLERAAPQFIDACRRQVARNEQAAVPVTAKRYRPQRRGAAQPAPVASVEAIKRERDAAILQLNQVKAYAPKVLDEAREWTETH